MKPSIEIGVDDPRFADSKLASLAPTLSALFVRGQLPSHPGVAVVGTRAPSQQALRYASLLAEAIVAAGFAVWSGGALGIDAAAHEGALAAGGPTVLVSGGGLDRPYPTAHRSLYARVLARGALVSIVPDGAPVMKHTLLGRNAVLAALTVATVVVECPVDSGARSTAAAARRLGLPVHIAAQPPWSPFAPAVREELRLGARPFFDTDDLLASLGARRTAPPSPGQLALPLSSTLPEVGSVGARLLDVLRRGPRHPDALADELCLPVATVSQALVMLCLDGHAEQVGGLFFVANGR